jgi:hypothetical protein
LQTDPIERVRAQGVQVLGKSRETAQKFSVRATSLDSSGSENNKLQTDPIELSTQDAQALDVLERQHLESKVQTNPPNASKNQEADPPLDLPMASDSDTSQVHSTKIPVQMHQPRPGKVKGARTISDPFRLMGNHKKARPQDNDQDTEPVSGWSASESDLPPSDPPVESDDEAPLDISRTPIQARLRKNCTPTKKAPPFIKKALERQKDLEETPTSMLPRLKNRDSKKKELGLTVSNT